MEEDICFPGAVPFPDLDLGLVVLPGGSIGFRGSERSVGPCSGQLEGHVVHAEMGVGDRRHRWDFPV